LTLKWAANLRRNTHQGLAVRLYIWACRRMDGG